MSVRNAKILPRRVIQVEIGTCVVQGELRLRTMGMLVV